MTIHRLKAKAVGLGQTVVAPDDFEEWVRPHLGRMALVAARFGPAEAADDVVQEALMRAWRKRAQYDPAHGSPSGWLCTITANEARRRAKRPRSATIRAIGGAVHDLDARLDVQSAISQLPDRQRLAIDWYYYVGLSIAETAAVMQCAEGTVKSTLADARSNLRNLLGYKAET